jgi:hypothetical protein
MTEEEFKARFAARVRELAQLRGNPFGKEPDKYAADVVSCYWEDRFRGGRSPEDCAEEDAGFWETDAPESGG